MIKLSIALKVPTKILFSEFHLLIENINDAQEITKNTLELVTCDMFTRKSISKQGKVLKVLFIKHVLQSGRGRKKEYLTLSMVLKVANKIISLEFHLRI